MRCIDSITKAVASNSDWTSWTDKRKVEYIVAQHTACDMTLADFQMLVGQLPQLLQMKSSQQKRQGDAVLVLSECMLSLRLH